MENETFTNDSNGEMKCYLWIKDYVDVSRTDITLDDMNYVFMLRLVGGIIFVITLGTIGLVGNMHVIYIYGCKFKQSIYRVCVLWLSFIDIVNFGICAPLLLYYLFKPLTYQSEILCKIFRFLLYACALCSSCVLVVIAIDRCLKILLPLRPPMKVATAKICCAVCVAVAVIFSWPALLLFKVTDIPTGVNGLTGKRCLVEITDFKIFAIFSISHLAFFVVVSAVLIFTYSLIGRKVWRQKVFREKQKTQRRTMEVSSIMPQNSVSRQSSNINSVSGTSQRHVDGNGANRNARPETSSSLAKTTGTLFLVTLAYILSAIPHHLLSILFFVIPNFDCNLSLIGSQFFYVFIWSYMINSTLNPFIYGFRDTRFRREMKLIYRKY